MELAVAGCESQARTAALWQSVRTTIAPLAGLEPFSMLSGDALSMQDGSDRYVVLYMGSSIAVLKSLDQNQPLLRAVGIALRL